MAPGTGSATFRSGGEAYDFFMGRYAAPLAPAFADLAGVTEGQRALDVGCGTGMLTAELVGRLGVDNVAACDPAPAQLAAARARCPGVDVRQASAEDLPFEDDSVDVCLAQLVLHFVPDPERGVAEMARVTVPGGRVAVCVWDALGGMEMLRLFWQAGNDVDAAAPEELRTMRFGHPDELAALLRGAGLVDVVEETVAVEARYEDVDELWSSLRLGVGPAGAYLAALPGEQQEALRTAYLERLGPREGSFTLGALARAAVATVP
ncbi:class I SAM-dependent methyltransferase [Ornithinimicrobium avium]|uniref:Methyltransferase domain-containing protein n=1 Tax=Ornithinimicrobium avium TaxID=2283195 RepID=A0A345NL37_9MICO|nr:methyltransferase domain-containing protein [Ornithinimicrobium avium]AXH95745.1 methyltransferase domain-containing protein [Ornithinimicrobium avium]